MRQTLTMLVELQSLEDALRDLRLDKESLARLEKENIETREVFEEMLAERSARIDETAAFATEKEGEIKEAQDSARRARTRMSHITSQRELTALNKELEIARRVNQQRSEELLKLMEQLEEANEGLEQRKAEYAALDEQMKAAEQEIRDRIAQREADASDHRARQQEIRGTLDRGLVSRFQRTIKARKGVAVAPVNDKGACSGCRLTLPPQQFIRLRKLETLEYCQNCRRILVYMPALEGGNDPAAVA